MLWIIMLSAQQLLRKFESKFMVRAALLIGPCQHPRKSEDCDCDVAGRARRDEEPLPSQLGSVVKQLKLGDESLTGVTL
jgi:hypothetical protein